MSITDELRNYTEKQIKWLDMTKVHYRKLFAIADRIDAEHEKQVAEAFTKGAIEGIDMTEEHSVEYIELPKDADGEIIHVGDMMETERFGVVEVEGFIHNAIAFNAYDPQPARICTVPANQCRHYHEPTVEDVLREFAEKMNENLGLYTGEAIDADEWRSADAQTIAEYAKRLKLAESED